MKSNAVPGYLCVAWAFAGAFFAATAIAGPSDLSPRSDFGPSDFMQISIKTNLATVYQHGEANLVKLAQQGHGVAAIAQSGMGNSVVTAQAGQANLVSVRQTGNDNLANTTQQGSRNEIELTQTGRGNVANIAEFGDRNRADILQAGSQNLVRVQQFGRKQQFAVQQYGSGLTASVAVY